MSVSEVGVREVGEWGEGVAWGSLLAPGPFGWPGLPLGVGLAHA